MGGRNWRLVVVEVGECKPISHRTLTEDGKPSE